MLVLQENAHCQIITPFFWPIFLFWVEVHFMDAHPEATLLWVMKHTHALLRSTALNAMHIQGQVLLYIATKCTKWQTS